MPAPKGERKFTRQLIPDDASPQERLRLRLSNTLMGLEKIEHVRGKIRELSFSPGKTGYYGAVASSSAESAPLAIKLGRSARALRGDATPLLEVERTRLQALEERSREVIDLVTQGDLPQQVLDALLSSVDQRADKPTTRDVTDVVDVLVSRVTSQEDISKLTNEQRETLSTSMRKKFPPIKYPGSDKGDMLPVTAVLMLRTVTRHLVAAEKAAKDPKKPMDINDLLLLYKIKAFTGTQDPDETRDAFMDSVRAVLTPTEKPAVTAVVEPPEPTERTRRGLQEPYFSYAQARADIYLKILTEIEGGEPVSAEKFTNVIYNSTSQDMKYANTGEKDAPLRWQHARESALHTNPKTGIISRLRDRFVVDAKSAPTPNEIELVEAIKKHFEKSGETITDIEAIIRFMDIFKEWAEKKDESKTPTGITGTEAVAEALDHEVEQIVEEIERPSEAEQELSRMIEELRLE